MHGDRDPLRYDLQIDLRMETSHSKVLRLVGHRQRVLDLGCATGALATALRQNDCSVVGVDIDATALELASSSCERVVQMDLERGDLRTADLGKFDVIVAADILEHLRTPERLLRILPELLNPHGYLVTSVPNISHGSVRLALLCGQFPYRETGLLDETHVRFYTRTSMCDMLRDGGFNPVHIENQVLPVSDGEALEALDDVDAARIPEDVKTFVAADPDASVYQFIAVCYPRDRVEGIPGLLSDLSMRADSATVEIRAREALLDSQREEAERDYAAVIAGEQKLQEELATQGLELLRLRDLLVRADVRKTIADKHVLALQAHISQLNQRESDFEQLSLQNSALKLELESLRSRSRAPAYYRVLRRVWRAVQQASRAD